MVSINDYKIDDTDMHSLSNMVGINIYMDGRNIGSWPYIYGIYCIDIWADLDK